MTIPLWVAVIGGLVALFVAYINGFIAEEYRRFRDGSALAASLAGELASYEPAWATIAAMLDAITADPKRVVTLRPFEKPKDLVFEDAVGRLGLLGAKAAEDVVYVYSNIRAFRLALELVSKDHKDMSDAEIALRSTAAKGCIDRALDRGAPLLVSLKTRAAASFHPIWPWQIWRPLA